MKKKVLCADIDFEHYWRDLIPRFYPLRRPLMGNPRRECVNCGLLQEQKLLQTEIKKWVTIE